jgi:phosphoserine phosphatase RsbU/P
LPKILIADDQPDVLMALGFLLKGAGSQTFPASSPAAVLEAVARQSFDAVIMDLNYTCDTTSGQEGLELVSKLRKMAPNLPIIVMTAWGTIDLAVEAMRRGAQDFILKPWDNAHLLQMVQEKIEEGNRQTRLQAELNARQERLRQDMAIARQVQINLFPREKREFGNIEYAAQCVQAGEVGGDYYDFLDVGPDRLAAVIADVSGKGIPAALLMANLQATLRSQCLMGAERLPELLQRVNRLFHESIEPQHFATLFFCCYQPATRALHYVNCGHNPPLLLHSNGDVQRLEATASVLGFPLSWECTDAQLTLTPGDLLVMYSDGVTEAGRDQGEEFGEDRLLESMRRTQSLPIHSIPDGILRTVREWLNGAPQEDDLTLVVLRCL